MIHVPSHHLFTMVLAYVRYAMGRMSTAPSTASELVRVYWLHLSAQEREQLTREVFDALAVCERNGETLGHRCDHETWTSLCTWMRDHLRAVPPPPPVIKPTAARLRAEAERLFGDDVEVELYGPDQLKWCHGRIEADGIQINAHERTRAAVVRRLHGFLRGLEART